MVNPPSTPAEVHQALALLDAYGALVHVSLDRVDTMDLPPRSDAFQIKDAAQAIIAYLVKIGALTITTHLNPFHRVMQSSIRLNVVVPYTEAGHKAATERIENYMREAYNEWPGKSDE